MVVLNLLNVRAIGPNGLIDFLLYNLPLGIEKTGWPMFILVGLMFFVLYYVIYRFLIVKMNFKTIGREDEPESVKLYTKKEYNEAKAVSSNDEIGTTVLDLIGGKENIQSMTHCYTRLRLMLNDSTKVDEAGLKQLTQASGVIINGESVHIVYGLNVGKVYQAVDALI